MMVQLRGGKLLNHIIDDYYHFLLLVNEVQDVMPICNRYISIGVEFQIEIIDMSRLVIYMR